MPSTATMHRRAYEDCRPTAKVFWYRDEQGHLIKAEDPRYVERETAYESFGFFGPEPCMGKSPTIITTSASAPLIVVHPPEPYESEEDKDAALVFMVRERQRSEKSRIWQIQRKKKSNAELLVRSRPTLQVPPNQFNAKVRGAYANDTKARNKKRVHQMLRTATILHLSRPSAEPITSTAETKDFVEDVSDAGSNAESDTAETVCDLEDLAEVQKRDNLAEEILRCTDETLSSGQSGNATAVDMLALTLVLPTGFAWTLFG